MVKEDVTHQNKVASGSISRGGRTCGRRSKRNPLMVLETIWEEEGDDIADTSSFDFPSDGKAAERVLKRDSVTAAVKVEAEVSIEVAGERRNKINSVTAVGGTFGDDMKGTDRIYMVHDTVNSVSGQGVDAVFPPPPFVLPSGEVSAEFLSPFTRAVGGEVTLDRHRHTARVQVFAGSRATRMESCTRLC